MIFSRFLCLIVFLFPLSFSIPLLSYKSFFIKPFKLLLLCINCCVNETIVNHASWCLGNQFQFCYTGWIYQFILKSICILLINSISLNMHAFLHKHSHRKLLVMCFFNDFFCFCVKNLFSLVPTVQTYYDIYYNQRWWSMILKSLTKNLKKFKMSSSAKRQPILKRKRRFH